MTRAEVLELKDAINGYMAGILEANRESDRLQEVWEQTLSDSDEKKADEAYETYYSRVEELAEYLSGKIGQSATDWKKVILFRRQRLSDLAAKLH